MPGWGNPLKISWGNRNYQVTIPKQKVGSRCEDSNDFLEVRFATFIHPFHGLSDITGNYFHEITINETEEMSFQFQIVTHLASKSFPMLLKSVAEIWPLISMQSLQSKAILHLKVYLQLYSGWSVITLFLANSKRSQIISPSPDVSILTLNNSKSIWNKCEGTYTTWMGLPGALARKHK